MTEPETYRVVRMYANRADRPVIRRGLTLEQAQQHCRDPETSSRTATSAEAKRVTREHGPWFDGYESETRAEREATEHATHAVIMWARNDEASYRWWCGMAERYAADLPALAEALASDLPNVVHVGDLGPSDWPSVDWRAVAEAALEDASD